MDLRPTYQTLEILNEEFDRRSAGQARAQRHRVRLGSLTFDLLVARPTYLDMLCDLLRLLPSLGQSEADRIDAASDAAPISLRIVDAPEVDLEQLIPHPDLGVVRYSAVDLVEIHRDAARGVLATGNSPQILIALRREETNEAHLLHCFMVVLYRALFELGCVPLHAAAAHLPDLGTMVFVGDKGAGKSTLSLALGRAGATVLGEDHILLRRGAGGFLVSGCDGRLRVTERTERHFFDEPLSEQPVDVAGVAKKDVDLGRFVTSLPYRDFPITRLFFSSVAQSFSIERLRGIAAVVRLLSVCTERQRFVDVDDRRAYIDYFSDLVDRTPCYDLTLSEDLGDLEHLVGRLRELDAVETAQVLD